MTALDLPMDISGDVYHFDKGVFAHAGYILHAADVRLHTHSFVEIAFVVGGAGTHSCLAGRRDLRVGDVVLLRPGVWHGYENCQRLELYNCCFSAELLRRDLAWAREDQLVGYLLWKGPYSAHGRGMLTFRLSESAFGDCMTQLEGLAALRHCALARYRPDILGRLSLLLGLLGRAVQPDTASPGQNDRQHPAVRDAMRLLESDIARRCTLTALAAELHLAPSYLVRLFKSATGLPPMAYLSQLRAENAAVLLLHSDETITAIGRTVGWSDQNYFARRFRAHYGLSATAYRKRFAARAAYLKG